jgi:hypothetical protein
LIQEEDVYYQLANSKVRIAGSMHLVPAGRLLPQWVSRAWEWSERLFLEHDDDPSIFVLPPGIQANAKIPDLLWRRISALIPAKLSDEPKLWTICMRLTFRDTTGYALGVETFIRKLVSDSGRDIEFLESPLDFAALLDAVDSSVILPTILPLLQSDAPRKNLQLVGDIYAAWYENNLEKFNGIFMSTGIMKIAELRAAMIDRRNENWLPKIESLLSSSQNILIIVGAGHVGGDRGLLSLLNRRGITHSALI